jgi:serine protease Do
VQDITEDIAKSLKLKETAGALVSDVFEGDPADKAGIKAGDIVVEIDGKKIKDTHELLRIVASLSVGRKIDIKVLRDGEEKAFHITIAERKEDRRLAATGQEREYFGMMVQKITPEIARHLGLSDTKGVVIAQVKEGSPADEAGIRPGDVILQVNRVKVSSLKDYLRGISRKGADESCLLLIKRGDRTFFVGIQK